MARSRLVVSVHVRPAKRRELAGTGADAPAALVRDQWRAEHRLFRLDRLLVVHARPPATVTVRELSMALFKRFARRRDHSPPILIGQDGDDYLAFGGTEHVALMARTGSGKTSSFCIPNAFNWPGSLIVLDVKGEIYAATAGHRAQRLGQKVF